MDFVTALTQPVVLLGGLLLLKHFIADGPLQFDYMAYGKSHFGHPGGIAHAAVHGIFTLLAFLAWKALGNPLNWELLWQLTVLDMAIHYTVDLFTGYFPRRMNWTTRLIDETSGASHRLVTDRRFYWVLVGDQCLHFFTYLVLASLVLAG